jgi:putative ABC transport system permease protein
MTSLLAVKLRRDLHATWPRLAMMVVAIAASLTVFGGVMFAWSAIHRETEAAYLGTEPASATIRLSSGTDAEKMAALATEARARPGVLEATGRTEFTSEIEVHGRPADIPLQVFAAAPDDPLRMAKFHVQDGSWPPATGEIFLREDSFSLLDVAVGDTVTVTTPDGKPARLRVTGAVYDPSLAPTPQQQTGQGYVSTASLAALGEPDVLDQLKIQIAGPGEATPSRDRDAIVAAAGGVATWLQREHGLAVREIQVPRPYAHPHQGQINVMVATLLIGAAAALLLATILVATMLNGLFTQQIPQIGIMKAVGARSAHIGRLYLVMTLVVAAAATLLALAPAILLGRTLVPHVFELLGIQAASTAPAWWTYLVVLAAGLVLPVLMALIPLVKASRTTVRAAIDHHGGGSDPRAGTSVLARLGRVPGLDRGLLMALRNTIRRPARFLLAVGLLASAGMMFVAGLSARDGTKAAAAEANDRLRWDVAVKLTDSTPVSTLAPLLQRVPDVSRVEYWTISLAGIAKPGQLPVTRTYPDQGHGGLFVAAIPAGTTMLAPREMEQGRWLRPGETGSVVLNQVTLAFADSGIRAGDSVQLSIDGKTTTWRVAGVARERGDTGGAYVTAEDLAKATGQPLASNTLRIATDRHDEQTGKAVAAAVYKRLADAGVKVESAEAVSRQEAAIGGHLDPILLILMVTAVPMGVIACIGLASTMGANVLDRTREFGVMHAIGARPKTVRRIVVAEGVFIALASCLLAVIPAVGLTAAMDALLGKLFFLAPLPFRVSVLAVVIWTALVALGAVLATNAAATQASRLTVREALAYL